MRGRYGIHHPRLGYLWFDYISDAAELWNNAQSLSVWENTPAGWQQVPECVLVDVLSSCGIPRKQKASFDRFNREPA